MWNIPVNLDKNLIYEILKPQNNPFPEEGNNTIKYDISMQLKCLHLHSFLYKNCTRIYEQRFIGISLWWSGDRNDRV